MKLGEIAASLFGRARVWRVSSADPIPVVWEGLPEESTLPPRRLTVEPPPIILHRPASPTPLLPHKLSASLDGASSSRPTALRLSFPPLPPCLRLPPLTPPLPLRLPPTMRPLIRRARELLLNQPHHLRVATPQVLVPYLRQQVENEVAERGLSQAVLVGVAGPLLPYSLHQATPTADLSWVAVRYLWDAPQPVGRLLLLLRVPGGVGVWLVPVGPWSQRNIS